MVTSVVIRDESMNGELLAEIPVEFPTSQITVSELIRSRVYQEVRESNARAASTPPDFSQRVTPSDEETILNGPRPEATTPVDWPTRFQQAVEAFRANQIMILVDDRQVTSLDDQIEIRSATRISFLRLTLLMGG